MSKEAVVSGVLDVSSSAKVRAVDESRVVYVNNLPADFPDGTVNTTLESFQAVNHSDLAAILNALGGEVSSVDDSVVSVDASLAVSATLTVTKSVTGDGFCDGVWVTGETDAAVTFQVNSVVRYRTVLSVMVQSTSYDFPSALRVENGDVLTLLVLNTGLATAEFTAGIVCHKVV